MKTYGVIMAGGGGTRFWPLSREDKPKQFLNLSGKNTMVVDTALRLSKVADKDDIFVVTNAKTASDTIEQTASILKADHILGEPAARNTAACIGYAAAEIIKKYEDGIMVVVPSDHFIKDEDEFARVLKRAVLAAETEDKLVTVGIRPTFPSTGYGYIRYESTDDSEVNRVLEFVEKPPLETAVRYLDSGEYAWNSGMFIWKASTILKYFEKLLPDIYEYLMKIMEELGTDKEQEVLEKLYPQIPKISIDYGIMERADGVLMLEGDFGWNDVGSFDAFDQIHEKDANGNVALAANCSIDSKDNVLYSTEGGHLLAVLGVEDLVIAHTKDVTLVCDKSRAQDIKLFADRLREEGKEVYLLQP
ncbi:MAG: NTP transferase domain-containing protein [Lachnospiraceae bacterium]|nr:NTP transferase domain-containing protein [Lachnospiraceae bacterium]